MDDRPTVLELTHLSRRFGSTVAVGNTSSRIDTGEMIGIIGGSGLTNLKNLEIGSTLPGLVSANRRLEIEEWSVRMLEVRISESHCRGYPSCQHPTLKQRISSA